MTRDLVTARRNESIRDAVKAWATARLIDERIALTIENDHADRWHRKSAAWRILIFFFTCVFASALFGSVAVAFKPHSEAGVGVLLLGAGVILATATEVQSSVFLFDGVGSESATSFLAIAFLFSSAVLWIIPVVLPGGGSHVVRSALLLGSFCAGAAWRWGYPLYAAFAAICLLAGVAFEFDGNRLAVILAGLLLLAPSEFLRDREAVPSSHRLSLACVSGASLAALYAAMNRFSVDHRLIEQLVIANRASEPRAPAVPSAAIRLVAAVATAMFPLILIALGLLRRNRLLLDAGVVSAGLSFLTLRQYVHLGPTCLVLFESGLALTIAALLTERFLRRSPGGERAGFCATPEIGSRGTVRGAEIAALLWSMAPSAGQSRTREPVGGGGSFGGGGATGGY